jgi:predicted O-methyltransferase YrrM
MRINKIIIDTTNSITELCDLGVKYPTDKSPYNNDYGLHKHPYTAIYNFLFLPFKNKNINFAEIGIYLNMSMMCWREFFTNANLYGFEYESDYLTNAIEHNLNNTKYSYIDITNKESLNTELSKFEKFDIILEDSTHRFEDQINLCEIAYKYMNPGGILIIEDIFRNESETRYLESLQSVKDYYSDIFFIETEHSLKQSPGWDNDKLLILYRNDKK